MPCNDYSADLRYNKGNNAVLWIRVFYLESTMNQDRAARQYAVPVRGSIWGLNYNDRTERDLQYVDFYSTSDTMKYFPFTDSHDMSYPASKGASRVCPIRILQPHYGELIECYADLQLTPAAADNNLTMKLAIGKFQSGSYDPVTSYTDEEINASWRKIHGTDTPLSVSGGVISAELIDLLHALPKYGDSAFREDAFVLLVAFNKVPIHTGTFHFNFLNIHTSVTGAI